MSRRLGLLEAHMLLLTVWSALLPLAFITGWIDSVRFVNVLSVVALILTSAVGATAAWADRKNPNT